MSQNNEYQKLIAAARRKHIKNINDIREEIIAVYVKAAEDLGEKLTVALAGSLTERALQEYRKALVVRVRVLASELETVIKGAMKISAGLPASAQMTFLEDALGKVGITKSFKSMFSRVPDKALQQLVSGNFYKDRRGLSKRIWAASKKITTDIDYIIKTGLAEKKSAFELAKDLDVYLKPTAKKPWNWSKVYPNVGGTTIDFNTQRLARTSINHAYWLSNVQSAAANPFVQAMHWELSAQHYTRQVRHFGRDVCDENANHDEGLGVGNFPANKLPVPHPMCLCSQWSVVVQSSEEIGKEIGDWMRGGSNAKLDSWNEQYQAV